MSRTLKCLACFTIGFGAFVVLHPETRATAVTNLTSLYNTAVSVWTGIPDPIKGIITLGIPSACAIFFAWTKTRAMQKLNETQSTANQQIRQLQGEKLELQNQVHAFTKTGETYTKTAAGEITDLATELKATQDLVTQKNSELSQAVARYEVLTKTNIRLEEDLRFAYAKIKKLQEELDRLKGIIPTPID